MRIKSLYRLPVAILVAICAAIALAPAHAKVDYDTEAARRKAEYIALEAQIAYENQDYDLYCKLVKRAYELDSLNPEIYGEWALVTINSEEPDSLLVEKAYDGFRTRFLANPDNYFNGAWFAAMAMKLNRYNDAVDTWQTLESRFPKRTKPSEMLADTYLEMFKNDSDTVAFNKAIEIYDRFELGGKSVSTISQKIQAYYLKGDTAAIIDRLMELDSIAPDDSRSAWFIGSVFETLDDIDLALSYYNRSSELDSTFGYPYRSRAQLYIQQGDTVAFEREVLQTMNSTNLEFESKFDLVRSYLVQMIDRKDKAEFIDGIFNTLLTLHPGEPMIPGLYSTYLMISNRNRDAIEQLNSLLVMTPDDQDTYSTLAGVYLQEGDTAQYIGTIHQAMERFPESLNFPMMLGYHYYNTGDLQKAVETFDSVLIDTVYNPKAVSFFYSGKGDILAAAGDTIRALETYDKAIELDPDNALALNNAAYFMATSGGDLDKAERYSLRSLKDNDLNPTYLDTYAWVLYCKKDYLMAKMYIDIAINSLEEEMAEEAHEGNEDAEAVAVEEVETEEELVEDESPSSAHADVYDHAGDIYFMNGDRDKALEFWTKALEGDPDNKLIKKKVENKTIFFE